MFGKITKPCENCPFRREPQFQGLRRAQEIANSLERDSTFSCHQTTHGRAEKEEHCAGAVKVMLSQGISNQMMRIGHRLGFFKPEDYEGGAECFDDLDEWVSAMDETNPLAIKEARWELRLRRLSRQLGKPLRRRRT